MDTADNAQIISRIRFLIGHFKISQAEFARRLGIDPANMSKHLNGKLPITDGLINRIAADMGVSKSWLAAGSGLPFAKETSARSGSAHIAEATSESDALPIYDIDVTAGALELGREFTADRIIGSINLPDIRPGGLIVRVNGDSMVPVIADGAYVAIRPVNDPSCIFWGQIYVIVLDDFRMVKYLRRHHDPSMVILRSANPQYDDMEIRLSKIRRLYVVESILNLKIQC